MGTTSAQREKKRINALRSDSKCFFCGQFEHIGICEGCGKVIHGKEWKSEQHGSRELFFHHGKCIEKWIKREERKERMRNGRKPIRYG